MLRGLPWLCLALGSACARMQFPTVSLSASKRSRDSEDSSAHEVVDRLGAATSLGFTEYDSVLLAGVLGARSERAYERARTGAALRSGYYPKLARERQNHQLAQRMAAALLHMDGYGADRYGA